MHIKIVNRINRIIMQNIQQGIINADSYNILSQVNYLTQKILYQIRRIYKLYELPISVFTNTDYVHIGYI